MAHLAKCAITSGTTRNATECVVRGLLALPTRNGIRTLRARTAQSTQLAARLP